MKWTPSERLFKTSVVALLVLTATAKLLSASGTAHVLGYPDPIFGLSNRYLLLWVAAAESAVIAMLLSKAPNPFKFLGTAWLGGNFLLYRLALAVLKPGAPCKCLGTVTERLHVNERLASTCLTVISAYLLVGGLYFLAVERRVACRSTGG